MTEPSRLAPLRIPAFARIAGAYTVNEFGNWLGEVALAVLVFAETGDPLAVTALFLAWNLVPAFVAPALTARLDQLAVRWALPALYAIEAVAFVGLAFLSDSFFLPAILAIALVDGTLALTGRALSRATIAALLEKDGLLREGNAIVNVGFAAASATGPALGGVVVAGLGVSDALLLDAASFALIAALLAATRGLPAAQPEREDWLARAREGLRFAWKDRWLRTLLSGQAVALVFFTTVVPIEIVYAKDALGAGDRGYGLLLAAWGAGLVVGSLIFTRTSRRPLLLIALSTALVGVAYIGMAVAGTLALACAISAAGGCGNGIQWVAVVTAVQERTGLDLQARIVGLLESIGAAMPALGFLLGGVVASIASSRAAFATAGVGVLVVLALAAVGMRRAEKTRVDTLAAPA
jgi:predicted MFS family arabinose efflux permease